MKYQLKIVDKREDQLYLDDKRNYKVPNDFEINVFDYMGRIDRGQNKSFCLNNAVCELRELNEKVEITFISPYSTTKSKIENIFRPIIDFCNFMTQYLENR